MKKTSSSFVSGLKDKKTELIPNACYTAIKKSRYDCVN